MNTIKLINDLLNNDNFKQACVVFNAIDDYDVYEKAVKRFPVLVDYDSYGNWQGTVANENGWTP